MCKGGSTILAKAHQLSRDASHGEGNCSEHHTDAISGSGAGFDAGPDHDTKPSRTQHSVPTVSLGPAALSGVPQVTQPEDVPSGTRLIVVQWEVHHKQLVAGLRAMQPQARLLAWLPKDAWETSYQAMAAGYDDVAVGEQHLQFRIALNEQQLQLLEAHAAHYAEYDVVVSLLTEIAAQPDLKNVLRVVVTRMGERFNVERVSVMLYRSGERHARVVMAQDGTNAHNLRVPIVDYPELKEVMRTRRPLLISDVIADALLEGVRDKLAEAQTPHKAAVLFPLVSRDTVFGALFLRSTHRLTHVDNRLMATGALTASLTAVAIGYALEHDNLLGEQEVLRRRQADADATIADLQQSKGFLENLIQSSVEGILAVDPQGHLILVNRAAESILGLCIRNSANVTRCDARVYFPEGEWDEIQRRMRSDFYGGRDRLELGRHDLLSQSGERIPVNLTAASVVADDPLDDTELATVFVFTDLRERVRMEQLLDDTKERLQVSQRQAVAVELAAAAAHELNQPLTTMMGYAEIWRRRLADAGTTIPKPLTIISREADRMAAIVKRIGQITGYRTKAYVGDAKMLALDEKEE